jgi:hypothetical protein
MKKKEEKEKNCLLAKGNHEEKRGKGKEQLARFNLVPLVFQANSCVFGLAAMLQHLASSKMRPVISLIEDARF